MRAITRLQVQLVRGKQSVRVQVATRPICKRRTMLGIAESTLESDPVHSDAVRAQRLYDIRVGHIYVALAGTP